MDQCGGATIYIYIYMYIGDRYIYIYNTTEHEIHYWLVSIDYWQFWGIVAHYFGPLDFLSWGFWASLLRTLRGRYGPEKSHIGSYRNPYQGYHLPGQRDGRCTAWDSHMSCGSHSPKTKFITITAMKWLCDLNPGFWIGPREV